MSPFELSPAVENLKVFFTNFSDLDGRLDPLYYFSVNNLDIVNATKYPVKKLSDVIAMTRGRFGHRPRNDPRFYGGEYPFIQTGDIVRASQGNGKITYSQTLNELGLKTSRLFDKPVVVITIAANIGDTAILDYPACFPDSLIGMQPKNDNLTLEYINLYFKFIKDYLNDLAPQSAQKNINYQQLSPVPIVIPPLPIQNKAVEIYKIALNHKEQKEQQAKALLAEIDTYLLNELGVVLPEQDNSLDKRMFFSSVKDVSGGRFDSDFHRVFYKNLTLELLKNTKVEKIKDISLAVFQGVGKDEVSFSEFKLLKVKNIKQNNQIDFSEIEYIKHVPHRKILCFNDIISPFIGEAIKQYKFSSFVERQGKYTVDNNTGVIRINTSLCNPIYVCDILNSVLVKFQIDRYLGGGGVPFLGASRVKEILIPIVPIEKQNEIAAHIQSIREQAAELQREAVQILEDAKVQIERMILGDSEV